MVKSKKPQEPPSSSRSDSSEQRPVVTYADIAREAGVSRMTVSLALRNHPDVSRSTAEKVRAIAERMGYRPDPEINRLMSYLRQSREGRADIVIAFLDPWPRDPAIPDRYHLHLLIEGARARADELGFRVDVLWLKEPGMTQRRMNSILYTRGIRGLLIPPLPTGRGHITLDWNQFSCVVMDDVMKPDLHRVTADQFGNAQTAFRQLRKLGYERIALIETKFLDEKVDHAFSAALHWHNARCPASRRVPPLILEKWDAKSVQKFVQKQRPDVIVSMFGESQLREAGLELPGKIALASLYNTRTDGSLAGINPLPRIQGAAAVDLLVSQLMRNEVGIPKHFKRVLIRGEWVPGATAPKAG